MVGMNTAGPIIAIATAPGRGGIGVIRISSGSTDPQALDAWSRALLGEVPQARQARYLAVRDDAHRPIDQGIALLFVAPHSYTGETVLEFQGHGGPVVQQLLLERCFEVARRLGWPLRLAEPGEFTQRAFLNDKIDLAQAEAVADLIDAQTSAAARSAAASLDGVFSREVHRLVDAVIDLRMLVEATLDFPEEEIEFLQQADALGHLQTIETQIDRVLSQARHGSLLRDGLKVVLAGVPNAGKSSLLNALAGEEVAIVTPIAGTTRDKVQQTISIAGIPLIVIDTAGLRDTADEVEALGIARTWREVARADVVVHLHDPTQDLAQEDAQIAREIAERAPGVPVLDVINKCDLVNGAGAQLMDGGPEAVRISAHTHEGLEILRARLCALAGVEVAQESGFIARERHVQALKSARAHVRQARIVATAGGRVSDASLDLFAEELRLAQDQLSSITGAFGADDLLGVIFSRFCIGK